MAKIKVLVIDDSVVIRQLLHDALSSNPLIEVIGRASNGQIGVAKIRHSNPNVVILDVEMPEMNGFQVLKEIRRTHPQLPIIMFSTLTTLGAEATFDALSLGATDYVPKPESRSLHNKEGAQGWIRTELVPKVIALGARYAGIDLQKQNQMVLESILADNDNVRSQRTKPLNNRVDIVGIGVSTGGPNALATLLTALPKQLPVPILVVQHMPPIFTKILAERLCSLTGLAVKEAENGQLIEAGKVYIAPGGFHMTTAKSEKFGAFVQLNQDPPENSCRPSVDVLFRSITRIYGANTLGIIMTGMGADGFRGCEMIYDAGGQIIAQDEATSVVWGMPGYVAKAKLTNSILPLEKIAPEIIRILNQKRNGDVA